MFNEAQIDITLGCVPCGDLQYVCVSGVPRNFVGGGGGVSTNSVEDREKGDLGAVAP